jgi:fumarate hydratase, class II
MIMIPTSPHNSPQTPSPLVPSDQSSYRIETDALGAVNVPSTRLWGAQTQRSLQHFAIAEERMPLAISRAYGLIKKAAALVNAEAGILAQEKAALIVQVAEEIIAGKLDDEFPLYVWQTGSGTQTNMNVNEVISNRGAQMLGGKLGSKTPLHPNDDVNLSQSSNDTFPTAMHLATVLEFAQHLFPNLDALIDAFWEKAVAWVDIVKLGRTHLQDATPLTVGQEWSGYVTQLQEARALLVHSRDRLYPLAAGGTAVGTGLNAPLDFGVKMAARIAEMTGHPFVTAPNKFAVQASLDAMVQASAALRSLAIVLMKIANDIRWLSSGPRAGLHELNLAANEPGSSIMPGKVNPTQEEAVVMVSIQVIGNDNAVAIAGSQGNFELNTLRPLVIRNVLHSARLLSDACEKWRQYSIEGITLDEKRISQYVGGSLMLVTALTPLIGYDQAAAIAHIALEQDISLREAALTSGYLTAEDFDRLVVPAEMVGDPHKDLGLS